MEIEFVKMVRILHIERYFVMYPHKMYIKKLKKKYQKKWENAYLIVKNARASRALSLRALDPGPLTQVRFAMSAKSRKNFRPPPLDQILDPLLDRNRKAQEFAQLCILDPGTKNLNFYITWREPKRRGGNNWIHQVCAFFTLFTGTKTGKVVSRVEQLSLGQKCNPDNP